MKINALVMDAKDNVATCIREIRKGETVCFRVGEDVREIQARENIPYCHKIAMRTLKEGDPVVKYGEVIGETCQEIQEGCWVYHENIRGIPRDYTDELL